ncbi:MAG TPA: DUF5076 domain-containing protein [Terriglobales bacterium]|nr:DUF5076 domain-containing protein [Terriglobales bacterium]
MFGLRKPLLKELPIPEEARSDEDARELIRAWAAHRGLHCSLSENSWGDNERQAWGILVADVVRQIANALHETKGLDKAETVREIKRAFDAALDPPSAETTESSSAQ